MAGQQNGGGAHRPSDPHLAFCFRLEISGADIGAQALFKSVSGLQSITEPVPYKEGGFNVGTRNLVGSTKYPNIVLKRGFTGPPWTLLRWRQNWLDDSPGRQLERLSGKITQLSSNLQAVCHWHFHRGWPCKWEGPLNISRNPRRSKSY